MKKRYVILGVILCVSLLFTGCGKENTSKKTKKTNEKTITLKDDRTGYVTTFNYPSDGNFEMVSEEQDRGAFVQIRVENKDLNISLEMYYFATSKTSYETGQKNREESKGYKEYTWNGYKGYSYNGDKNNISFNVLLDKENEDGDTIALFGTIDTITTEETDVTEVFNGKVFQNFLNSMKFKG